MPLRLFAITCGWLTGSLGNFLAGESGTIRVPIPCFLIDHPHGKVLFDSGLHRDIQSDPAARLGWLAQVYQSDFHPGEDVAARLASVDVEATRIHYLVNSHLHFDHVGGNAAIPNARLVVQRPEWVAGHDADLMRANAYNPKDYDLGHDLLLIDGEHDLFGDGRVVCFPTYGHTPGHQSLRVRLDSREVILTGDACYLRQTLDDMHLPPIVHDEAAMRASLQRLRELRAAGAQIVFGHDPEYWASVPQAPLPME